MRGVPSAGPRWCRIGSARRTGVGIQPFQHAAGEGDVDAFDRVIEECGVDGDGAHFNKVVRGAAA